MKHAVLLFLLFISSLSIAQKKFVDARVIFKDSDKIDSVQLLLKLFPSGAVDPLSINNYIKVLQNGKTSRMNESEFYMIEFRDDNGKKRTFYSGSAIGREKQVNRLYEEMYHGRISWYRDYLIENYGSITYATTFWSVDNNCIEFFIKREDNSKGINLHALLLLTIDREDLEPRILKINTEYDLKRILQDYEIGKEATIDRLKKSSMSYRMEALKNIEVLDTVAIEYPNQLKADDNVVFKGASGDVFAVANEDGSGRFVEIKYLSIDGQTSTSRVQIKDVRIVRNEI